MAGAGVPELIWRSGTGGGGEVVSLFEVVAVAVEVMVVPSVTSVVVVVEFEIS